MNDERFRKFHEAKDSQVDLSFLDEKNNENVKNDIPSFTPPSENSELEEGTYINEYGELVRENEKKR